MKNIAIFASGSGTNAENIAKTFAAGNRIRVAVVVTDHEDAGVVARMEALDIPVLYFPGKVWKEEPEKIVEALRPYAIDLVALAGFMRKVADPIIEAFPDRMINIHPSLLPAYGGKGMYGHHVHEAVIAAGEKQSGVTVHKVTSDLDSGEIVMQGILEIEPGETAESLESRIHAIEYEIFPRAIAKTLNDLEQSAVVPPAISRRPTPDEMWAEALHLPSPKSNETNEQAAEAGKNEATPPPVSHQPIPNVQARSINVGPTADGAVAVQSEEQKPATTYLTVAIIFMLIFGLIPGIFGVIYAAKARKLNSEGNFAGARKASNVCQGWIIATFCLGVLFLTLYVPMLIASLAI